MHIIIISGIVALIQEQVMENIERVHQYKIIKEKTNNITQKKGIGNRHNPYKSSHILKLESANQSKSNE